MFSNLLEQLAELETAPFLLLFHFITKDMSQEQPQGRDALGKGSGGGGKKLLCHPYNYQSRGFLNSIFRVLCGSFPA
jgi:hypothetical protein